MKNLWTEKAESQVNRRVQKNYAGFVIVTLTSKAVDPLCFVLNRTLRDWTGRGWRVLKVSLDPRTNT